MSTKTNTTGDRFSVTVHVTAKSKFLRDPAYRYQVVIRDEQEAKALADALDNTEWGARAAHLATGLGAKVEKTFSGDDPHAIVEALRAAADALEAEAR